MILLKVVKLMSSGGGGQERRNVFLRITSSPWDSKRPRWRSIDHSIIILTIIIPITIAIF